MSGRRILVVSPVFHGYGEAIRRAFESRGHWASVYCYDRGGSIPEQIGNKLLHELPEKWRPGTVENHMTQRALDVLNSTRPDVVVMVKGDQLGPDWWQALADRRLPRVTWLYDELRRLRYTPEQLRSMGPIASYSAQDAGQLSRAGTVAVYLPLAYDDSLAVQRTREDHVSFVGARYQERERQLRELAGAGVAVRAYGRTWSRHPVDVLRTRQFAAPGFPTGRDLTRSAAYGVMQDSPATLNIHGDQDGFTMRTFEAAGVGGVQILDRAEVSRFYEVDTEVLVFESAEALVELSQRALRDHAWADRIRQAGRSRTLAEHTFSHRVATLEQLWG